MFGAILNLLKSNTLLSNNVVILMTNYITTYAIVK